MFAVEYGKACCTPWTTESFERFEEAEDRFTELCDKINDGSLAADTVMYYDERQPWDAIDVFIIAADLW